MELNREEEKILTLFKAEMKLFENEIVSSQKNNTTRLTTLVSDGIKRLLDVESCTIFIFYDIDATLRPIFSHIKNREPIFYNKGIVGSAFLKKESVIVSEVNSGSIKNDEVYSILDFEIKNLLIEPLYNEENEAIGVLEVVNKNSGEFSKKDSLILKLYTQYLREFMKFTTISNESSIDSKSKKSEDRGLRSEINIAVMSKDDDYLAALKENIYTIFNIQIIELDSVQNLEFMIKQNRSKSYIFIYIISSKDDIKSISDFLDRTNTPVVIIGPSSSELALFAGNYQINSYIGFLEYSIELLKDTIEKNSHAIIKNKKNSSFMASFIGVSGGIGTTTISVNLANLIAKLNPLKNILFVDIAQTKAISNIFLGNPKPQKNIITVLKSNTKEIKDLLDEGLFRYSGSSNFYFIPGIQSHIQKDELYNKDSEKLLLEFLHDMKRHFDYIIVDCGVAEDSDMKLSIEELSDELYLVTELTTVHLSILKTLYGILKKAGWRDNIRVVINRADSKSSISADDAKKIINDTEKDKVDFDNLLPNESDLLRECMNYGELITQKYPDSNFSKALLSELVTDEFKTNKEQNIVQNRQTFIDKIKNLLK